MLSPVSVGAETAGLDFQAFRDEWTAGSTEIAGGPCLTIEMLPVLEEGKPVWRKLVDRTLAQVQWRSRSADRCTTSRHAFWSGNPGSRALP